MYESLCLRSAPRAPCSGQWIFVWHLFRIATLVIGLGVALSPINLGSVSATAHTKTFRISSENPHLSRKPAIPKAQTQQNLSWFQYHFHVPNGLFKFQCSTLFLVQAPRRHTRQPQSLLKIQHPFDNISLQPLALGLKELDFGRWTQAKYL